MGRRTTAVVAVGLFLLLALIVAGLTRRDSTDAARPTPPSTYLSSPDGASAIAEAAVRIGIRVDRWRSSYRLLESRDTLHPAPLFVVLGPWAPLTPLDALALLHRAETAGPVLLAGPSTNSALACFGWNAELRGADSIRIRVPVEPVSPRSGWVWATMHRAVSVEVEADSAPMDETAAAGVKAPPCRARITQVDTLLETTGRRPVLLRVGMRKGYPVYLLSDASLLSNRVLRRSDVGPYLLHLFATTPGGLRFDEYHQGYDEGGSLQRAVLDWSAGSPWGWMAWQLIAVGVLALLAAMLRTGPVRSVIRRARRSPLEHVRALATALRTARGHDVAVDLLVRGLRRRLSRDGRPTREPSVQWLSRLQDRVRSPRAHAAVGRLGELTRPGRSADEVLAAANAVEVVWQEFRP